GKRVKIGTAYEQLMKTDYPYAAVVEFDNVAGLGLYLAHPAHEDLGLRLFASVEETLVYDFEIEDGAGAARTLLNEPPDLTGAGG
ncbi:MAG: Dabb family protein, partial [Vicinamibacterales bacterium]